MARHTHLKTHGFIESIEGERWWARLYLGDMEYSAEMVEPLPAHAEPGSRFTIHMTKAGDVYFYWITRPWTKRELKKARQRARVWAHLFD